MHISHFISVSCQLSYHILAACSITIVASNFYKGRACKRADDLLSWHGMNDESSYACEQVEVSSVPF